jgi:hypothetical protein
MKKLKSTDTSPVTFYYYRYSEFMSTRNKKVESCSTSVDFLSTNLLEAKKLALDYYLKRKLAIEEIGQFGGLEFAAPQYFHQGINSCYSANLYFIVDEGRNGLTEYAID